LRRKADLAAFLPARRLSWRMHRRRRAGGREGHLRMTDAARHIPVLGEQAVAALAPRAGGIYIDATFGAGGYSRLLLAVPGTRVIGIDRDRTAVAGGFALVDEAAGRLTLVEDRFSNLAAVARTEGADRVDGVVMDIGVSSMQLDEAARGFSFRLDGPLDMRMGGTGPSAADVVAKVSEQDLARIIYLYGEERRSRAVARAIGAARRDGAITTTRQLADLVARVVRAKPNDIHPATRTFQALRILVNEELSELETALRAAEQVLKPGGRLAVVSFHSLEDRIVKTFLAARAKSGGGSRHLPDVPSVPASFRLLTRRPVVAADAEVAANPRARSAKLRAAERTEASPCDSPPTPWPTLGDVMTGGR
jgi:16S rRNA (cytosine1402-N4)-methyltransferase